MPAAAPAGVVLALAQVLMLALAQVLVLVLVVLQLTGIMVRISAILTRQRLVGGATLPRWSNKPPPQLHKQRQQQQRSSVLARPQVPTHSSAPSTSSYNSNNSSRNSSRNNPLWKTLLSRRAQTARQCR
jgi:hypothetical protein